MNRFFVLALIASITFVAAGPNNSPPPQPPVQPVFSSEKAPTRSYFEFPGIDMPNNDISYTSTPFSTCGQLCDNASDGKCIGYVEEINIGFNCWFKSAAVSFSTNGNRNTKLLAKPARDYTTQTNFGYSGNDIAMYFGTFGQCSAACDAMPGCVGYVQDLNRGFNCWLKSAFSPTSFFSTTSMTSVVLSSLVPSTNAFLQLSNTMFYGDDIIDYVDLLFPACAYRCSVTNTNNKKCIAFTENTANKRGCWLKYGSGQVSINSNMDSFIQAIAAPRVYNFIAGAQFTGNDLSVFVTTPGTCQTACDNVNGCVGFSVDIATGTMCNLKGKLNGYSRSTSVNSYSL